MIYVDQTFVMESRDSQAKFVGTRTGHRWCHMWCDAGGEDELHTMASRLGLRRAWFQPKRGFPHYDLVPSKRILAVRFGVTEVALTDWLRAQRRREQIEEAGV